MYVLENPMPAARRDVPRGPRRREREWGSRATYAASPPGLPIDPGRSSPVELVCLGLDHTTARIELRERLTFAAGEIPAALGQLIGGARPALEQAAILSTCNRVELYGVARARPVQEDLAGSLARYHGLAPDEIADAVYVHRRDDVAYHIAATAAGMNSLVLGEAQIQGQVRTALEHALTAGTAGPELRRLFESAIAAGRRVRAETSIGRGIASVPHAGIEFAAQRLGTLKDRTVLLIGAGTISALAAKHIAKHGGTQLLVLARDPTRAARLAEHHGGRAVTWDRLDAALALSDIVISSTGAPRPILRSAAFEAAMARRAPNRSPIVVVDLAVPRDVEPAVGGLFGVELHTGDDLRGLIDRTLAQRRAELPAAHSIVRGEVARFARWLSRREMVAA